MTPAVVVSRATLAEKPAIDGLFQFYAYHFSAFEDAASDDLDFGPNGLFEPFEWMETYFTHPSRSAHLIRVGGKLAGFILLNAESHCGAEIDVNIGEFFVAQKFRRWGVGAEALRQITAGRPGRWEAAILRANVSAQAFWPGAIAAVPGVRHITTTDCNGDGWNGPVLHFTVP